MCWRSARLPGLRAFRIGTPLEKDQPCAHARRLPRIGCSTIGERCPEKNEAENVVPHAARPSFLVGLIGAGIQASRTPSLHEQEGAAQGLRYLYRLIDLEELGVGPEALPELLIAAERAGFAGLNITHPCKQAVIPLLTDLSEDARVIGAVNTAVLRDARRIGSPPRCPRGSGREERAPAPIFPPRWPRPTD